MLAYVIIAIELAILYTVFWYVFLREPKPYRIKGNPWGGYDADKCRKAFQFATRDRHADDRAITQEWAPQDFSHDINTPQDLIRSRIKGVTRSENQEEIQGFLSRLGQKLNLLSTKIR